MSRFAEALARSLTDVIPADDKFIATFHRDEYDRTVFIEAISVATGDVRARLTPVRDAAGLILEVAIDCGSSEGEAA